MGRLASIAIWRRHVVFEYGHFPDAWAMCVRYRPRRSAAHRDCARQPARSVGSRRYQAVGNDVASNRAFYQLGTFTHPMPQFGHAFRPLPIIRCASRASCRMVFPPCSIQVCGVQVALIEWCGGIPETSSAVISNSVFLGHLAPRSTVRSQPCVGGLINHSLLGLVAGLD